MKKLRGFAAALLALLALAVPTEVEAFDSVRGDGHAIAEAPQMVFDSDLAQRGLGLHAEMECAGLPNPVPDRPAETDDDQNAPPLLVKSKATEEPDRYASQRVRDDDAACPGIQPPGHRAEDSRIVLSHGKDPVKEKR